MACPKWTKMTWRQNWMPWGRISLWTKTPATWTMPSVLHLSQAGGQLNIYKFPHFYMTPELGSLVLLPLQQTRMEWRLTSLVCPRSPCPTTEPTCLAQQAACQESAKIGLLYSLYYIQILLWYSMIKSKVRCPARGQINYVRKKPTVKSFQRWLLWGSSSRMKMQQNLLFPRLHILAHILSWPDLFQEFENAETLLISEVHMLLEHRKQQNELSRLRTSRSWVRCSWRPSTTPRGLPSFATGRPLPAFAACWCPRNCTNLSWLPLQIFAQSLLRRPGVSFQGLWFFLLKVVIFSSKC